VIVGVGVGNLDKVRSSDLGELELPYSYPTITSFVPSPSSRYCRDISQLSLLLTTRQHVRLNPSVINANHTRRHLTNGIFGIFHEGSCFSPVPFRSIPSHTFP
jgi:hypothetical protein